MSDNSRRNLAVQRLLEETPAIIYALSEDTAGPKIDYLSKSVEAVTGYSRKEFLKDPTLWRRRIHSDDYDRVMSSLRTRRVAEEYRFQKADGTWIWIYEKQQILDCDAEHFSTIGIAWDITSRKEAEEQLRFSAAQLKGIVESQNDLIVRVDLNNRFTFVNDAYCMTFGKTREELIGQSFTPLVHEADIGPTLDALKAIYDRPHRVYIEQRAMTVHGWRWLAWEDSAILDTEGKVIEIQGVGRDITVLKEALRELEASEERYRGIVEDQTELICRFLPDGTLTFVNRAYCDYFGKTEPELIGNSFMPLIPEDDHAMIDNAQKLLTPANPVVEYEHRVVLPSGEIRWQSWTDRAVYDDNGVVIEYQAVGRDITGLKSAIERAELNERLCRTIVQDQTELICRFSTDGKISFANAAYAAYFGRTPDELIGTLFMPAGQQSDEDLLTISEREISLSRPILSFERKIQSQSGEIRWQEWTSRGFFDASGAVTEYQLVGKDVTERVIMQRQLQAAKETLEERVAARTQELHDANQRLIEEIKQRELTEGMLRDERNLLSATLLSIGEGVIATDPRGIVTGINWRATEILGKDGDECRGLPIEEVFAIIDEANGGACDNSIAFLTRDDGYKGAREHVLLNAAGRRLLLASKASPICAGSDEASLGYIISFRDLTEIRHREIRLALAQKLESVGRMAAGIAHEINSPMQYIGDNARYLQRVIEGVQANDIDSLLPRGMSSDPAHKNKKSLPRHEALQAVEDILEGVARITKLVQSMRTLSHPGSYQAETVNVNDIVASVLTISRSQLSGTASLTAECEGQIPLVSGSPSEISQVLINLILNAAHAVEDAARQKRYTRGKIEVSTASNADFVIVRVKDNGIGIETAVLERIFEPFFTTKDVGRGTGQGLSIAYDIVVGKHGGNIEIDSVPGSGTTVTVLLPRTPVNQTLGSSYTGGSLYR